MSHEKASRSGQRAPNILSKVRQDHNLGGKEELYSRKSDDIDPV